MKILIAAEIYPPSDGGPAVWLRRVVPELKKRGHELRIVTFGDQVKSEDLGVKTDFVALNQNKLSRFLIYKKLLLQHAQNYDIILALGNITACQAALKIKANLNKPVILRVPGDFAWEKSLERGLKPMGLDEFYENKFGLFVEWLKIKQTTLAKQVDYLVTNSIYQAEAIAKYWLIDRSKINTIKNIFTNPDIELTRDQAKQKLGWNKRTIVMVGRLIELKGQQEVIIYLEDWLKKHPDWQMKIIGAGPLQAQLLELIKSLDLEKSIELTGLLEQPVMANCYQAADAFILNSLHESSPNVILEAMYFDLPIIASKRGGTIELLEEYPRGVLFEWGNKTEFLEAVAKLDKLKNIGWPNKDKFFTNYSLEKNITEWENIFNNLVNK